MSLGWCFRREVKAVEACLDGARTAFIKGHASESLFSGKIPGGPVAGIYCLGPGFSLWWGNRDPTSCMPWPKNRKGTLFSCFETSTSPTLSEMVSLSPESLVPFRGLEPRTERHLKFSTLGIPWWPCGWDSAFSLPGPGFHPWSGN